jgi:hypothetical protein
MDVTNLNKQQQRTLDSYLKSSQGYLFHFLVTYFGVQFTSLCLSFEQIFMLIFFIFKETSIMRHFRSFCHIIDYVTLRLYNNFHVSQTCHIKEVKQYAAAVASSVVLALYLFQQATDQPCLLQAASESCFPPILELGISYAIRDCDISLFYLDCIIVSAYSV